MRWPNVRWGTGGCRPIDGSPGSVSSVEESEWVFYEDPGDASVEPFHRIVGLCVSWENQAVLDHPFPVHLAK